MGTARRLRLVVSDSKTGHSDRLEVGEGDLFPFSGWTIERSVGDLPMLTIRIPMVYVDVEWADPKPEPDR
jgi:hypothetical protein